mgnify:CR=1 FL=1
MTQSSKYCQHFSNLKAPQHLVLFRRQLEVHSCLQLFTANQNRYFGLLFEKFVVAFMMLCHFQFAFVATTVDNLSRQVGNAVAPSMINCPYSGHLY